MNSNQPTRIAYVIGSFGSGGTEHYLIRMLEHLDRETFEPFVVTLSDEGPLRERAHELAEVYSVSLGGRLFNPHGIRELFRLRRWLRKRKIELVHLLMDRATIYGSIAARIARTGGIPAVASHRMSVFPDSMRSSLILLYRLALRYFVSHVIPNSATVAEMLLADGLVNDPSRITVVHNGIPAERLRDYREPPNSGAQATLCIVGLLRPEKGHIHLFEALARLRGQGARLKLIVVGAGSEESRLRNLAEKLDIADLVEWMGYREQPMAEIERSDICILSSLNEGFPNVVVEYMACGRPVVATWVGGVHEIVIPGETGYLVPPGDSAGLADAIAQLLANPELRRKMGAVARESVLKNFTASAEAVRTMEVYEQAVLRR